MLQQFRYQRRYQGAIQAIIFDWAGTVIDHGCMAPTAVFIAGFEAEGVAISATEARIPMGVEKREHIRQVLALDSVQQRWQAVHGQVANEVDIDRMYAAFIPRQLACLQEYAQLIPGTLEVVQHCKQQGIKIGGTTGYNVEMLRIIEQAAAEQGYQPDYSVCAAETRRGRPYPDMAFKVLLELGVDTVHACVKVDDTPSGISEGLSAGMWTVGVVLSGNETGLSYTDLQALDAESLAHKRQAASTRLLQAGAHYVVDSVADLPACLAAIQQRLWQGEQP